MKLYFMEMRLNRMKFFTKFFYTFLYGNKWIPDEMYVKMRYYAHFGVRLDLKCPKTFNEKLQWLKLNDRNPRYTKLVDKYEVKKYISEVIGSKYVIPLLGVWDTFDDIDFKSFPEQFVLKCTHDSGGIVICKDKKNFDINEAKKKLEKSLKENFFYWGREWPYKDVKPRIIAEQYMVDESGTELKDYKVLCFNGTPKLIDVDYNRYVHHMRNLYTTDWKYINAEIEYPTNHEKLIERPEKLDEMLQIASKLSKDIPFVRVDFYVINNQIYFGEMTFYHESGIGRFRPESFDYELGKMICLPGAKMENYVENL